MRCFCRGFFAYDGMLAVFLIALLAMFAMQLSISASASNFARGASISRSTAVSLIADYLVRYGGASQCTGGGECIVHHQIDSLKLEENFNREYGANPGKYGFDALGLYVGNPPPPIAGQYCARRMALKGGSASAFFVCGR